MSRSQPSAPGHYSALSKKVAEQMRKEIKPKHKRIPTALDRCYAPKVYNDGLSTEVWCKLQFDLEPPPLSDLIGL